MAKKKQKYYVVWEGVNPGIYTTWDMCNAQIKGYPGARYKSFSSMADAEIAFGDASEEHIGRSAKAKVSHTVDRSDVIWDSLSVDAACSGSPGIMEYRGVWTEDGVEVFRMGPFDWGTNNVGEFLALVHGLAFLKQIDKPHLPIYSDSRTALAWLRNKKIKTTLQRKSSNQKLFELLARGEKWIKNNQWSNDVLKWNTKKWGEIPADFGRK
jgi:Predicted double-stranded RNA/RNA-DNA hybrid binding protein